MATDTANDLQAELRQLRADIAKISETVGGLARQGASDAAGKAKASLDAAVDHARSHVNDIAETIQEKPLSSAVTAFGIGVIFGMLFAARRG
ncbi:MAG TPA: hypothetical protein VKS60_17130 [Stellaceae bacterium]|nr:hypothetical protein [Stellaceae bacterium]